MIPIWGWILPRKRIDQTSAEEQIEALKTTQYVLPNHCLKSQMHLLQPGRGADYRLACGCVECKPELWCKGTTTQGARCPEPAFFPEGGQKPEWCMNHYRELVRRGRESGGAAKQGVEPPAALRNLIAWAGKGRR